MENETTPVPETSPTRAVTWRSVLISLLLLPINAYWVVQMEMVRYSAHPTIISLFFNVVFFLLLLTLLNRGVERIAPRFALTRGELLFIYAALAIGSCLCGHQMYQILVPMLAWDWNNPNIPAWALVNDKAATKGYFAGHDTIYRWDYIRAWLTPTLVWVGFTGVMCFVMLCINAILRKQWTEHERLTYPVIQIPMEITHPQAFDPKVGLFRNPLFWIGFMLAASVDVVNSLNTYFPSIPSIFAPGQGQSFLNLADFFPERPWSAMGWAAVACFPFVIGLGVLMPLDFLFSCWFFVVFWKMEHVLVAALAWDADPRFPYENNQAFGAYMVFCVLSIWISRHYLVEVVRCAMGRSAVLDDTNEPIRYGTALLGMAGGTAVLVWFTHALGLGIWTGIWFFVIFFALSLAITRMRAELGTPEHDLHFTGPDWILTETLGVRSFTTPELTAFSLLFWFNRAYHPHPMPHQLEAFKLAEQTRSDQRKWFWGLAIFAFIGGLVAFWAILHVMYIYGSEAKTAPTRGPEGFTRLQGWLNAPKPGNLTATLAIFFGAAQAALLQYLRIRFVWFPFHPLAFAVSSSYGMALVWFPLFIAWVIKLILLRVRGRGGFVAAIPFFIGLILGQFVVGSLINILGILLDVPTYQFFL